MPRPRKNPDDPKWNVGTTEEVPAIPHEWNMLYAAALSGIVSRGGLPIEQMVKTAAQYADEAYTLIKEPRK